MWYGKDVRGRHLIVATCKSSTGSAAHFLTGLDACGAERMGGGELARTRAHKQVFTVAAVI